MKFTLAFLLSSLAMCHSVAHAQITGSMPSDKVIKVGLIDTAASMSQQTLNCGLISEKEVQEARALQRKSFPRQMGFSTAEYDKLYAESLASFNQKWAAMSAEKRQQTCQQTHVVNTDQL